MKYKHVFFDLDHTLWDYDTNSKDSLEEIFNEFELGEVGLGPMGKFCKEFKEVNQKLWDLYDDGAIDREYLKNERFKMIFESFGVNAPDLAYEVSEAYLQLCPTKNTLLPYAREVLCYLSSQNYMLSIVTNGFSNVQYTKLKETGIDHYFLTVITSDNAGFRKPSKEIFDVAIAKAGAKVSETVMIGDNLNADILGALGASLDAIYYNPSKVTHSEKVTHEIDCLSQLMNIF